MAVVSNKRPVMTLYSNPKSIYSHRVRVVLAEKNITVDIIDVDPLKPSEDMMDLNPYGTLPTLVDRDLTLYESRIIMEYLDERFPHPPLLPVDPVSRATSRLYMHRVDQDWYSKMQLIKTGGADAETARKELRDSLTATAPVFAAKPFFMNDDLTLADCSIAPLLWRLPEFGVDLPALAKPIHEYAQRIFERPSFQTSLTELERELRP
ncbi:Stringent starvation protein A [hydrothermal vent metagenome]|uniref:Stringent starvation protein A n=1 Tax=hydrothermal vent metagenome TaxID=652676 RepID=A0A3B1B5R3_9ZZZZ